MGNKFLEGNFAPVSREHTITELAVTGRIPDFLDGRYLRNGPNPLSEVDPAAYHWFMGDGMVHGVRLRDGKAEWYRNRWVRNPSVAATLNGEDASRFCGLDALGANTNVIGHAGRTLALVEAGAPIYELTDELDTVGRCDFDGTLPGGYTAHPKRDPRTGELHAVSYFFGMGNKVQYSVIDAGRAGPPHGRRRGHRVADDARLLPDREARRVLRPAGDVRPRHGRRRQRAGRARARPREAGAVGDGRQGPRAGPGDRDDGRQDRRERRPAVPLEPEVPGADRRHAARGRQPDVRWFEVEPCYVFHPLNAYDDGDSIVLDVVRHPKMFDRELHGPDEGGPTLDRWTVDLSAGKVLEERLDDRGQEFPRVDERLVGRRHRYGYSMAADGGADPAGSLFKHDFQTGSRQERAFGAGRQPGEFVFVPCHEDAAEDDGVLMGFVFDPATQRSDLTLLDAGTLETVAAIHLPDRVPNGFHGNWVESA